MRDLGVIIFVIALIVMVIGALWSLWQREPTDYWIRFKEQLEKDARWWRCQEGPGCDWPDHCTPGDCRRVDTWQPKTSDGSQAS